MKAEIDFKINGEHKIKNIHRNNRISLNKKQTNTNNKYTTRLNFFTLMGKGFEGNFDTNVVVCGARLSGGKKFWCYTFRRRNTLTIGSLTFVSLEVSVH